MTISNTSRCKNRKYMWGLLYKQFQHCNLIRCVKIPSNTSSLLNSGPVLMKRAKRRWRFISTPTLTATCEGVGEKYWGKRKSKDWSPLKSTGLSCKDEFKRKLLVHSSWCFWCDYMLFLPLRNSFKTWTSFMSDHRIKPQLRRSCFSVVC